MGDYFQVPDGISIKIFSTKRPRTIKTVSRNFSPGEKKIEKTIENCPKSTIANYKRLQI